MNLSEYSRRPSCEVRIGRVVIGGGHPVAVQSMTNTDTNDTEASVAQIERIDRAGGKIVRLTAQGRREGENLARIVRRLRDEGFDTAVKIIPHLVGMMVAISVFRASGAMEPSRPTFIGWKPSTSLLGSIASRTFAVSMCLGSGSCTRMPFTARSALSRPINSSNCASVVSADRRWSKLVMPSSAAVLPLLRT